jgi:hypothetical protein
MSFTHRTERTIRIEKRGETDVQENIMENHIIVDSSHPEM